MRASHTQSHTHALASQRWLSDSSQVQQRTPPGLTNRTTVRPYRHRTTVPRQYCAALAVLLCCCFFQEKVCALVCCFPCQLRPCRCALSRDLARWRTPSPPLLPCRRSLKPQWVQVSSCCGGSPLPIRGSSSQLCWLVIWHEAHTHTQLLCTASRFAALRCGFALGINPSASDSMGSFDSHGG